jgi:hypothetical protein
MAWPVHLMPPADSARLNQHFAAFPQKLSAPERLKYFPRNPKAWHSHPPQRPMRKPVAEHYHKRRKSESP